MIGHANVDLSRKLNEASVEIEFFGFPREIEGVDWDAMAAQTGAGIERLETEWLRRGRLNDLPYVQTHTQAEQFEFVNQCDIDASIDIFKKLRHFRSSGRRNSHDPVED